MTDTYRELFRSAGRNLDDYVRLMHHSTRTPRNVR